MKENRDTKNELLKAARAEFSEKGFQGASLRSICQRAHVTTGALYFFYTNKEDLFSQVIGNLVEEFETLLKDRSVEGRKRCNEFLCEHAKEMFMILSGAKGTEFEYVSDDLKRIVEDSIRQQMTVQEEDWIHILAEMQLQAYEELLTHDYDPQRRLELMGKVDEMFGA